MWHSHVWSFSLFKVGRYCSVLVSVWLASLIFSSVFSLQGSVETDATDDLSLSLRGSQSASLTAGADDFLGWAPMPREEVEEILSDRLDLFPRSQVSRLALHILSLCKFHQLNPAYVLSLIHVESRFRIKAVSSAGAIGLMQLRLPTAQYVVDEIGVHLSGYENFKEYSLRKIAVTSDHLKDPFLNITIGIAYLAFLRDDYEEYSPYHVLAAYNVGPGKLDQLLENENFQPKTTKTYFHKIRRGVSQFRSYRKLKKEFKGIVL